MQSTCVCDFILPILQDGKYTWMNQGETALQRVRNTCNLQWRTSQDKDICSKPLKTTARRKTLQLIFISLGFQKKLMSNVLIHWLEMVNHDDEWVNDERCHKCPDSFLGFAWLPFSWKTKLSQYLVGYYSIGINVQWSKYSATFATNSISIIISVLLLIKGRKRLAVPKPWIQELFCSLNDTMKAFCILLLTDTCVHFGWISCH